MLSPSLSRAEFDCWKNDFLFQRDDFKFISTEDIFCVWRLHKRTAHLTGTDNQQEFACIRTSLKWWLNFMHLNKLQNICIHVIKFQSLLMFSIDSLLREFPEVCTRMAGCIVFLVNICSICWISLLFLISLSFFYTSTTTFHTIYLSVQSKQDDCRWGGRGETGKPGVSPKTAHDLQIHRYKTKQNKERSKKTKRKEAESRGGLVPGGRHPSSPLGL